MLHNESDHTDSISYYNPNRTRIQKVATSGTAYRHWSFYNQSAQSANSASGVDMGCGLSKVIDCYV